MNHSFAIKPEGFMLDDKPMRIISGAIHYFRVPREYWEDRLLKLKACGFNTVETYIAWNAHQPTENEFVYDDMLDIVEFLRIAQRLGLYAIVRPGPYICSEWEFGALPWWLLKKPGIRLRCLNMHSRNRKHQRRQKQQYTFFYHSFEICSHPLSLVFLSSPHPYNN